MPVITLTDAELEAFKTEKKKNFALSMLGHLKKFFPKKVEAIGLDAEKKLGEIIDELKLKSTKTSERDACLFLSYAAHFDLLQKGKVDSCLGKMKTESETKSTTPSIVEMSNAIEEMYHKKLLKEIEDYQEEHPNTLSKSIASIQIKNKELFTKALEKAIELAGETHPLVKEILSNTTYDATDRDNRLLYAKYISTNELLATIRYGEGDANPTIKEKACKYAITIAESRGSTQVAKVLKDDKLTPEKRLEEAKKIAEREPFQYAACRHALATSEQFHDYLARSSEYNKCDLDEMLLEKLVNEIKAHYNSKGNMYVDGSESTIKARVWHLIRNKDVKQIVIDQYATVISIEEFKKRHPIGVGMTHDEVLQKLEPNRTEGGGVKRGRGSDEYDRDDEKKSKTEEKGEAFVKSTPKTPPIFPLLAAVASAKNRSDKFEVDQIVVRCQQDEAVLDRAHEKLIKKVKDDPININNKFEITTFNVGQGDAALITDRVNKKAILIDAGTAAYITGVTTKNQKMAEIDKIITKIKNSGLSSLHIIVTHADADHYSFIRNILEGLVPESPRLSWRPVGLS